jgi:hypothetical protein
MFSPNSQNKAPETDYIVMNKLSDGEFKTAVLRKLSELQENREMNQYSNRKSLQRLRDNF